MPRLLARQAVGVFSLLGLSSRLSLARYFRFKPRLPVVCDPGGRGFLFAFGFSVIIIVSVLCSPGCLPEPGSRGFSLALPCPRVYHRFC